MELRPSRVSRVGCAWIGACGLAVAQGTERVSVGANGDTANAPCELPSLSADGRLVAFSSGASNLVADDRTVFVDIFVRDRSAGTTELVSVDSAGVQGNGDSLGCGLSADGRFVAFESAASNLVADDTNGFPDVFVRDLQAGTTERVSVSSTGEQGDGYPGLGSRALSADGRWIVFSSYATHLVPGDSNGAWDVFVRDRATRTTERASLGPDGREGNGDSQDAAISTDGRFVAFSSGATNLVENDRNGVDDLFVFDRQNGATERVSVDSAGAEANGRSSNGSVSGDGRLVAFVSVATNLVAGDTNDVEEVFVHDRSTGATWRASVSSSGVQADGGGNGPELSADGRFVVF
jgi:Tol biopolymer transport system component